MNVFRRFLNNKKIVVSVFIVYMVLLFIGAFMTVPSNLSIVNNNDKLLHFFEFFFLSVLLFLTLRAYSVKNMYLKGVMLGLIFIFLSEAVQLLTVSRTFSYYDMLFDVAGFMLGMGVLEWIFSKQ